MKTQSLFIISVISMLGVLTACEPPRPPGAPAAMDETAVVPTTAPSNRIIADAVVVPARYVEVTFTTGGSVAQVFVEEGDAVEADAPLAQLDAADLDLQVAQSRAALVQAQAGYDKIEAGATPEEIAAQQALVNNAEANVQRTRSGNYTAADVANAQAQLRQAEAALAVLLNPTAGDLRAAEEQARQAEVGVQSIRDSTSQVKTSSELALQQAADALTQAQATPGPRAIGSLFRRSGRIRLTPKRSICRGRPKKMT